MRVVRRTRNRGNIWNIKGVAAEAAAWALPLVAPMKTGRRQEEEGVPKHDVSVALATLAHTLPLVANERSGLAGVACRIKRLYVRSEDGAEILSNIKLFMRS